MFCVSALLMLFASSRFSSSAAWGGSVDWNQRESVSFEGFMVVDLSDAAEANTRPMRGAAYASQLSLPQALDASLALPKLESMGFDDFDGLELPSSVKVAYLQLPTLLEMPTTISIDDFDFGPMPRGLEEFEAIILSTTDDGLRLPADFLTDLPGIELPDDDIILAEVSVNWTEHVVQPGDTLSDIAMRFGGITAQDILRANELRDANRLAAQQILLIPNSPDRVEDTREEVRTRKARIAAIREQIIPLSVSSYVVAAGDSLWSIANSQNLEVDTLIGSNPTRTASVLRPGEVLRIPNQDGIFHTFVSGDTIASVAERYRVAVDRIKQVNPTVDVYSLTAGNEIFLPGARPAIVAQPRPRRQQRGTTNNRQQVSAPATRNFRWPVMGRITSPFGWRRHPITRRNDFHSGIDIRAARGTVIRAAAAGTVVHSGWMGGYGRTVVIRHANGKSTLYAHAESLLVRQGDTVTAGQNIARAGSSGRATGPHLHFEVRDRNNRPVNPLPFLR